jgi:polar amino acid transport system permease protein
MMSYLAQVCQAIAKGSVVTLELFFVTIIFSIPLGLLVAYAKVSGPKILKFIVNFYIWLMRGTPLLLQLIFIFFGLPVLGVRFERFQAAEIAFILNYAAYFAEIFRSGIQSIDRGQYEGADVLGMTYWQTMRRIIFPQMLKRVIPPVSNEVITLVKDTSLIYIIGLKELSKVAEDIVVTDFNIAAFGVAAAFYLVMTLALTQVFKWMEKRYSYYE